MAALYLDGGLETARIFFRRFWADEFKDLDAPQSKDSKTLLQEWQVPPWWRDRLPLLYLGDELLAVGDLAQCESSRWRAAVQPGELLWYLYWERPLRARSD